MDSYSASSFVFRLTDRRDDVCVSSAATNIAAHPFPDFGVVAGMTFLQQSDRRTDLPRGAVTALKAILFQKRRLHRMQLVALRESFDGRNLIAFVNDRECEA